MENFKFDLTNAQVILLNQILEEEYKRVCVVLERCSSKISLFDSMELHRIDVETLILELQLQSDLYLSENNLKSFFVESPLVL